MSVLLLMTSGCQLSNAPVPAEQLAQNILFTSYPESPKHLDSTSSYSNNETPWTYAVYEPPLKYHYLKRPYELEPRTLVALPEVTYLDSQRRVVAANTPAKNIAESVFELQLKPGILFQPHPAFALNDQG